MPCGRGLLRGASVWVGWGHHVACRSRHRHMPPHCFLLFVCEAVPPSCRQQRSARSVPTTPPRTPLGACRVDAGVTLEEALAAHTAWLKDQGLLGQGKSFVPITWNDWDLKASLGASWGMYCTSAACSDQWHVWGWGRGGDGQEWEEDGGPSGLAYACRVGQRLRESQQTSQHACCLRHLKLAGWRCMLRCAALCFAGDDGGGVQVAQLGSAQVPAAVGGPQGW